MGFFNEARAFQTNMGIRNGNFHVVRMAAMKVTAAGKCLVSTHFLLVDALP
jgi:hypothetical protein